MLPQHTIPCFRTVATSPRVLAGTRLLSTRCSVFPRHISRRGLATSASGEARLLDYETTISGPKFRLNQSAIDKTIGRAYSQRTFAFAVDHSDDESVESLVAVLEAAYRECVRQVPLMGGTLVAEKVAGGSNPYVKSGGGAKFIVKDRRKDKSFHQLRMDGFRQDAFASSDEWFGIPNWETCPPAESVVSLLQVNVVDNGILLTFCLSHNATDIVGWSAIVRRLAFECLRRQVNTTVRPPNEFSEDCFDRSPYDHGVDPLGPVSLETRHKGYKYYPKGYDGTTPPDSQWCRTNSARICSLSAKACRDLKSLVLETSPKCSTHDAVVALIWRSISRAMLNLGRTTLENSAELTLPVNTRARNQPPLPDNYVGNAFYITYTTLPVKVLVDDMGNSLAKAAGVIRESIDDVTSDKVHDLHRLIDSVSSTAVNKVVQARLTPANYSGPGFFLASHFSLKLQDWDWGPMLGHFPEAYRMTTDTIIPGIPNVFPRTRDGGLEIAMAWDDDIWKQLSEDPVWNQYVS